MKTRMIFVAMLGFVVIYSPSLADELLVPDQYPTIQAAIDAAADGDVVIVADGTYTGMGNKNLDFGGREITVHSENGPQFTTIDIPKPYCAIPCSRSYGRPVVREV